MVSHRTRLLPSPSRDRLLRAAAAEFAARGFDGAKVDRIAAQARVNKAMLYYHFRNKAAIYRAILTDLFQTVAAAVHAARDEGGAPDVQIRAFIRAVAAATASRPHFPAIWLREMAEGGRHLDVTIVSALRSVLDVLAGILTEGCRAGVFRPVHPLITQMGIVAPLLLFTASAPIRARFQYRMPHDVDGISREELIAYVEAATLAALRATGNVIPEARPAPRRPRR